MIPLPHLFKYLCYIKLTLTIMFQVKCRIFTAGEVRCLIKSAPRSMASISVLPYLAGQPKESQSIGVLTHSSYLASFNLNSMTSHLCVLHWHIRDNSVPTAHHRWEFVHWLSSSLRKPVGLQSPQALTKSRHTHTNSHCAVSPVDAGLAPIKSTLSQAFLLSIVHPGRENIRHGIVTSCITEEPSLHGNGNPISLQIKCIIYNAYFTQTSIF